MRDQFIAFALFFGKRRSNGQKEKVIATLVGELKKLGYEAKERRFKLGIRQGKNIIVGDLKRSKVVYIADYDTRERILNKSFAFDLLCDEKNVRAFKRNYIWYILASLVLLGLCVLALTQASRFSGALYTLCYGAAVVSAVLAFVCADGLASKYNFQKTSALYLLMELARQQRKDRCFVFADLSIFSGEGRKVFLGESDLEGKKVVYLFNACTPGTPTCLYSENCKEKTIGLLGGFGCARKTKFPQAAERSFEYLAAGQCVILEDSGLYLEKYCTSEDIVFDESVYMEFKSALFALDASL